MGVSPSQPASFAIDVLTSRDGREVTTIRLDQTSTITCTDAPMSPNTDRPGNDISGTPVSGSQATPQWCQQSCCATAGCVAWVFVESQPGVGVPYCWLKDRVGPSNPLQGATAGLASGSQGTVTLDGSASSLNPAAGKAVYAANVTSQLAGAATALTAVGGDVPTEEWDGVQACPSTVVAQMDMPGNDYTYAVGRGKGKGVCGCAAAAVVVVVVVVGGWQEEGGRCICVFVRECGRARVHTAVV